MLSTTKIQHTTSNLLNHLTWQQQQQQWHIVINKQNSGAASKASTASDADFLAIRNQLKQSYLNMLASVRVFM